MKSRYVGQRSLNSNVFSFIPILSVVVAGLHVDANAAIRNRYSFNDTPGPTHNNSTVITDSVGGAHGLIKGANGFFTGTALSLPGGSHAAGGAYVDLPDGMISSITTDATFEAWYTITSSSNWSRIFDFGDSGSGIEITEAGISPPGPAGDTIFFSPQRANSLAAQRFSIENDNAEGPIIGVVGGEVSTGNTPNVSTPIGQQVHVAAVIAKDADGDGPNQFPRLTVFMNGLQVAAVNGTAATPHQLANLNDINNWLGKSNYPVDLQFAGELDEFRIHDHAFTAGEAGRNNILGPNIMGELLTLEVWSTGEVKIRNQQNLAIPIDYYRIYSPDGALNPMKWMSRDDMEGDDPVGEGWDESAGSDMNELIEYSLEPGGIEFPANGSWSLGKPFNPMFGSSAGLDLVLEYGDASGRFFTAPVTDFLFVDAFGDYNGDGYVNAADYTVYRNCKSGINGCTDLPGEVVSPGVVDIADYNWWKSAYTGGPHGDGASIHFSSEVPEPAAALLFFAGLVGAAVVSRNRRLQRQ